MIGKNQVKRVKCADLAFDMTRLHLRYVVVRIPIVLDALGCGPPDPLIQ